MYKLNEMDVFEYLSLNIEEKLDFFNKTLSNIPFSADYWFNFEKVRKNVDELGADIFTLDFLVGKNKPEVELFFKEKPELLKLIPKLLGIRSNLMKNGILGVDGFEETYYLNFEDIEINKLDKYIEFIDESGLMEMFKNGISKSVKDYYVGVEAGMDSNGRKNRSGKIGEEFLEKHLSKFASENGYEWLGQTTTSSVKEKYDVNLEKIFDNRRFDGSLYKPESKKLILFEINIFNAGGSKSKSASTEFQTLKNRISSTYHDFIYITDGDGWKSDQSHLREAIENIGHVFNTKMVKAGWVEDYLLK